MITNTRRKSPTYNDFVAWIARNDDPEQMDEQTVSGIVTVCLVADLFGKQQRTVARDVVAIRRRQ